MTTVETNQAVSLGGKPNPGTPPDQRLKANQKKKPPAKMPMKPPPGMMPDGYSADDLARIAEFIDALFAAPEGAAAEVDPHAGKGTPFTMLMAVEGLETSDGRMFEIDGTSWRTPMPFMVQDTSPHGPGQVPAPAWAAGQIENVYRDPEDPTRILGDGHLMDNAAGQRAEEIIRGAFRGVSVDAYSDAPLGPDVQPTVVDQEGNPVSVLLRYADPVITRVTLVPTPAFSQCCVWLDGEDMPEVATAAHGAEIPRDAEPETIEVPVNAYEMLVASGGGPLNPPKAAFFQPEPEHRQEMIVDPATGFISGHLFGYGECHTAYADRCETSPKSRTVPPFVAFHRTEAHCEDGTKVACGWIPVNTNHSKITNGRRAAESWTQEQTWDHYEHSGTLLAKVRASNGRYGVWLSGVLLPGLADRELAIAQGLSVSGHWNVFTDPRNGQRYPDELLAVLGGVPQPGYPETRVRAELLVASGQVVAHIDPLGCAEDCEDCDDVAEGEGTMTTPDARLARLEQVVGVLVALGGTAAEEALAALDAPDDVNAAEVAEVAAAADAEWLALADTPLGVTERAAWFAKYDQAARDKAAKSGHAMPDGSYIIEDVEDLKNAIRAVGRGANNSHNAIRKHIMRQADRLGQKGLIPPTWQADGSLKK